MIPVEAEAGLLLSARFHHFAEVLNEEAVSAYSGLRGTQLHDLLRYLDDYSVNFSILFDEFLAHENLDDLTYITLVSIMVNLEKYLSIRGLWYERLHWCSELLLKHTGAAHLLLNIIGSTYSELGQHDRAIECYEMAIQKCPLDENDPQRLRLYGNLGVALWSSGNLEAALVAMRRIMDAEQNTNNQYELATALANLSQIHQEMGDLEGGLLFAHKGLEMAKEMGNEILQAQFLSLTASHLVANGMLETAVPAYQYAITLLNELKDEVGLALTFLNYGILLHLLDKQPEALELAQTALAIFEYYQMADEVQKTQLFLNKLTAPIQFARELTPVLTKRYLLLSEAMLEVASMTVPQLNTSEGNIALHQMDREFENIEPVFAFLEHHPEEHLHQISIDLYLAIGNYLDLRAFHEKRRHWGWLLVEQAKSPDLPDDLADLFENPQADALLENWMKVETIAQEQHEEIYHLAERYNKLGWRSGIKGRHNRR